MRITLKLFATLSHLLPDDARRNAATIEVDPEATLNELIDQFRVPRQLAHLVLINGVFVAVSDRDKPGSLQDGDVLAIWPPIAGG